MLSGPSKKNLRLQHWAKLRLELVLGPYRAFSDNMLSRNEGFSKSQIPLIEYLRSASL
jgi:hypothetical protein